MKKCGSRWLFTVNLLNLWVTASTLLTSRTSSEYSSVRKFISSVCLLGRSCFKLTEFQWTGYSICCNRMLCVVRLLLWKTPLKYSRNSRCELCSNTRGYVTYVKQFKQAVRKFLNCFNSVAVTAFVYCKQWIFCRWRWVVVLGHGILHASKSNSISEIYG